MREYFSARRIHVKFIGKRIYSHPEGVTALPANLTPQYYAAEEAFRQAATIEDKIAALQEMLAVIPKHKGTEKLQADIRRRLSRLREEGQKKSKAGRQDPFNVEKQGAGQVVLTGYPNTGKSAIVSALSRARVKVAEYPFTTTVPFAGMMPFEEIMIQLVDTPPFTPEMVPPGLLNTLRHGDALLLAIDLGVPECLEQLEGTLEFLNRKKIAGPFLIVGTRADRPEAEENLAVLRELRPDVEILPVSTTTGQNMELLRSRIFEVLNIIRVFSKAPGKPPDLNTPFVLPSGSTVLELAAAIHRDFPRLLKTARVWGSARFDGQSVPRDYQLRDRDIVEIVV
ncbi:GTP-binding protein RBG1 [Candidatus Desulforudis audaxviator]|nr:GTP-binding protein RBG1 [Candidatus Desulforudis audaxviator]